MECGLLTEPAVDYHLAVSGPCAVPCYTDPPWRIALNMLLPACSRSPSRAKSYRPNLHLPISRPQPPASPPDRSESPPGIPIGGCIRHHLLAISQLRLLGNLVLRIHAAISGRPSASRINKSTLICNSPLDPNATWYCAANCQSFRQMRFQPPRHELLEQRRHMDHERDHRTVPVLMRRPTVFQEERHSPCIGW